MTDNTQSDVVEALRRLDIEGHLADAIRDCFLKVAGKVLLFDQAERMAKAALTSSDAVLEERERCARIAEALPTDWRDGTQPGPLSAYRHASREIAQAIRKGDNA